MKAQKYSKVNFIRDRRFGDLYGRAVQEWSVMCLEELAIYGISFLQTKAASHNRTVRAAYPEDIWDASFFL